MNRILAVNLRDQRLRAEMSQETLARILRVSPSVIAAWEDGTAEPGPGAIGTDFTGTGHPH